MLVSQILKTKADDSVTTVKPGTRISQAAAMLSEKRIGTLVVSADGKTPDIVRTLGREGGGCLDDTVEALMTRDLITCAKDETADDILAKMTQGRFRHMPVLEDGVLIGLISLGDVVKARLMELSMEKDALEGMIRGH
jgi:CBS domain-containing protein